MARSDTSHPLDPLARALCGAKGNAPRVWVIGSSRHRVQFPTAWTRHEEELPVNAKDAPEILVVPSLAPSQLDAVVKLDANLLIWTDAQADDAMLQALTKRAPSMAVLGPGASLHVDPQGVGIALAMDAAQLWSLLEGVGLRARLGIAPVPDWLLAGLLDPDRDPEPVLGWLDCRGLGIGWAKLLKTQAPVLCTRVHAALAASAQPWSEGLLQEALAQELGAAMGEQSCPQVLAWTARAMHPALTILPERRAPAWNESRWAQLYFAHAKTEPASLALPELKTIDPKVAAQVMTTHKQLVRWREYDKRDFDLELPHDEDLDLDRAFEVICDAGESLTDHESKVVLKGWGFEVTRQAVAKSASAALSYAQKLGYPVALKAMSPQLIRKTSAECVQLDVENASALKRHYQQINDRAIREVGEDQLDGVLVSEMIPQGLDVHVRALLTQEAQWVVTLSSQDPSLDAPALGACAPPTFGLLPTCPSRARRLAARHLCAPHPQQERAIEQLAGTLLQLGQRLAALKPRLMCVELHPLRLLLPKQRPACVLDAYIEQDAHIQGS